jgi:hypothetical protein
MNELLRGIIRMRSPQAPTQPAAKQCDALEPHELPVAPRKLLTLPDAERSVVTLVVFGWANAKPGTLAWQYPNLRSAIRGAKALRNASKWAILAGTHVDVETARRRGELLLEEGRLRALEVITEERA